MLQPLKKGVRPRSMSYQPPTQDEIDAFVESSTRQERYRFAGRMLKLSVREWIERAVILCFLLALALPWVDGGWAFGILLLVGWAAIAAGAVLHASVAFTKPWLLMGAAFEALLLWAAYTYLVSSYFEIPGFGLFCGFLFTFRFWGRGERDVNEMAVLASRNAA